MKLLTPCDFWNEFVSFGPPVGFHLINYPLKGRECCKPLIMVVNIQLKFEGNFTFSLLLDIENFSLPFFNSRFAVNGPLPESSFSEAASECNYLNAQYTL